MSGLVLVLFTGFLISQRGSVQTIVEAVTSGYNPSQQQGTLEMGSAPYTPPSTTSTPGSVTTPSGSGPLIGGPVTPDSPYYCIDDEDPDGCDDNSSFLVPKGTGGVTGTCGTVIQWGHTIVQSLPHDLKGTRDRLSSSITSPCFSKGTGTYSSGYVSTFLVIDAYNLTGYSELSKSNASQISGTGMQSWWQSTPGYTYEAYTGGAQMQQNIIGKTIFINTPRGVHVGIVNGVEIYNANGDGILSILQSGTSFYIDRFVISGWQVQNTPQHQTVISGVAGFGGH